MVSVFICIWLFFGGTIDHIIFCHYRFFRTLWGKLGLPGNLLMALFDFIVALVLFLLFKRKMKTE